MHNPRRYRILASTALALVLAIPFGSMAINRNTLAVAAPVAGAVAELAPAPAEPAMPAIQVTPAIMQAIPASMWAAPVMETPATPPSASTTTPASPSNDTNAQTTTEQDPLASLDPADRAVAEKIRELLATKADKLFVGKKERAAVEAFYQQRNLAPLWLEKGAANARAEAVIARLKSADTDGLDPSEYKVSGFAGLGPDALADAELKLTRALLTYARHLQAGRFPYSRVSRNIELPQAAPEPADILDRVAGAADAGVALDAFTPQQEPYRKLKAMLAQLRSKPGAANARQIEVITANMERWRWYPRDLGNAHVQVNLPDFTLKVMHNGTQAWTTRIVVGKPSLATPLLSETMKYITVNPTWHVPQSIVQNEYLPAQAQDPTILERMGLRVSYNGGQVEITQPPGPDNALGRIRFNFPNRFSVYHHDTPARDKPLFSEEMRAHSHGCMRIQDPAKYAEVLLNIARPREHWTAERVQSMYGRGEQDIQLPTTIWVHLTYQTAFVDNAGKLQMRRDVYNLDGRTLNAIKSERGIVEAGLDRKRDQETVSDTSRPARPARTATQSMPREAPSFYRPYPPQPIYR